MDIFSRLQRGWNAFKNRDPTATKPASYGSYYNPGRRRLTGGKDRSIINSIFNRISVDVASVDVRHCQLDKAGRYQEDIDSSLNTCLTLSSNIDQTARAFRQDIVTSMLDEGYIAVTPIDVDIENPQDISAFSILSMRVAKVLEWYPNEVLLDCYNDRNGKHERLMMLKKNVALIENPFYSVINEPNSVFQRLARKLALMDEVDEASASGKMDLIIQLPYTVKSDLRKAQAEGRRRDLEMQLTSSKYGIAYADGTEKIVQLNRSLENNLLKHIEYLTNLAFSQIGMTQEILNGTADEQTMLNYNNRVIEPIVAAIVDEFNRKFISPIDRGKGRKIMYFRDPFKLVPVNQIAEIADKFTRNEIMTSNEIRQVIGLKPSDDPRADELINSNISQANDDPRVAGNDPATPNEGDEIQNEH